MSVVPLRFGTKPQPIRLPEAVGLSTGCETGVPSRPNPGQAAGMSDDDDAPIRGEVRRVGFRRVSHGLFLKLRSDLSDDAEFLRDLQAYIEVLPDGAVFTHVTAARLLGWKLPKMPEQVPVFAAVRGNVTRPRRHGLICSRLTHPSEPVDGYQLPIEAPEEVLLRAARDLGVLDLVVMLDSALGAGHLQRERLLRILASRRPGVRKLRTAYEMADAASESPGETVLRVFHHVMEVPVESQVNLYDQQGRHLGRADLVVKGTTIVHEYDGAHHRTGRQHAVDLRRERGWTGTSYQRRGFVLDDLLNHAVVLMHELDRVMARPHSLVRIRAWRALVAESMFSERGRARVMNRWRRQMGGPDWSGTA